MKRRPVLERAEQILMNEVPVAPIYFYVTKEMYRDNVKGITQNLQAIHPLKYMHRTDGKRLVYNNNTECRRSIRPSPGEFRSTTSRSASTRGFSPITRKP